MIKTRFAASALAALFFATLFNPAPAATTTPDQPVTVQDTGTSLILDNGLISLTMAKKNNPAGRNGEGISIKYKDGGTETEMSNGKRALYFDVGGDRIYPVADADAQIISNGPDMAEVAWISDPHTVTPMTRADAPLPPSALATHQFPFHSEFHIVMPRGEHGFYLYAIYRHDQSMAAGSIGETRFVLFGAGGKKLFTNNIVDDQRKGEYPLERGKKLQDVTFLYPDGTIYTKYNNSAYNFDHHVHGMAGHGFGEWMILPSNETIGGGPFKQELTVHLENALLGMLIGGHFGTHGLSFGDGETWSKVYGPVFVYLNHSDVQGDAGIDALWDDAKKRAAVEVDKWPYTWLHNPDYVLDRGTVKGHVSLADGASTKGAWAILSPAREDWTQVLKGYDYWAQVDADGNFTIPKVRPDNYMLSFVGADQFEEFDVPDIAVKPGDNAIGNFVWNPIKHGTKLWQIGTADRLSFEFKDGTERHFEAFARYLKFFPDDVTFTIGKSKEADDWYFAQFAIYNKKPYWTIQFDSPQDQKGKATLTIGFTSADPHNTGSDATTGAGNRTNLQVKVNGTLVNTVRLPKTGTAGYRSGTSDSNYNVVYVTFDASLLKGGTNQITLGHAHAIPAPADPISILPPESVMYDALRLEVDPNSAAPANPATQQ